MSVPSTWNCCLSSLKSWFFVFFSKSHGCSGKTENSHPKHVKPDGRNGTPNQLFLNLKILFNLIRFLRQAWLPWSLIHQLLRCWDDDTVTFTMTLAPMGGFFQSLYAGTHVPETGGSLLPKQACRR